MQEIELKFLVAQARLKGLMRQTKVKTSQTMPLSAHYYDTPKQDLAKNGIGLRIRREGDEWVQTIKANSDGIAARLEHNIILDNEQVQTMLDTDTLIPDLTLYSETPIEPVLTDFNLTKLNKKLVCLYVTEVQRTTRLLEYDNDKTNSVIEVAYDLGEVISGHDDSQRRPIQEIEFELVSGDLDFLFATAKIWCKRYKLCLSTVTKAESGSLLVQGRDFSPALRANPKQLIIDKDSNRSTFIRTVVHNCLLQILPNSSAIAAGSSDHSHVLQLSIGIRRLNVALNAFSKFSDQLNSDWLPILVQTTTLLDDYYKLNDLASHVQTELERKAPIVDWTTETDKIKVTPINAIRANDFQLTLLELIAFSMSDASADSQANKLAYDTLPKVLAKQYLELLKAEQTLDDISATELNNDSAKKVRHTLHRRIEALRYVSEFAMPLYSKKKSKRLLKRVIKAQKSLGQYLDHRQYHQYYQQKSTTDPNALYGMGWFAATLQTDYQRYEKHLAKLKSSVTFW